MLLLFVIVVAVVVVVVAVVVVVVVVVGFCLGNGQKGVHPPYFRPNGGMGKTRLREAFPPAPTWFKFNSNALAR